LDTIGESEQVEVLSGQMQLDGPAAQSVVDRFVGSAGSPPPVTLTTSSPLGDRLLPLDVGGASNPPVPLPNQRRASKDALLQPVFKCLTKLKIDEEARPMFVG
jgi:hypothetical protein